MPKHYKYLKNPEDTPSNPLTWERLMNWLADTGYIEGMVGAKISPLDIKYLDDYIQEVWVQILSVPPEKLMTIWYKGKGKFTNYIKSIVQNNIYSVSSPLYKNIRSGQNELVHLDDGGWTHLIEDENADTLIHFPVINRNNNMSERVQFEYEKINVRSDLPLSDDQEIL